MTDGRAVGVDLGSRRIGVAVCNPSRTLASPRTTLERSRQPADDLRAMVELVLEEEATTVVVGHPLSLDGSRGAAAIAAEAEAGLLRQSLMPHGVTVELFDERLTTVSAHRSLQDGGMSGKSRRKVIDRSAATVLLQAWLEGQHDLESR